MREFLKILAAADSVDAIRAVLDAGDPSDLANLADVVRQALEPPAASAYPIPGPYDIAMAFGAAAVASNRYDTPGAAMAAAWFAVPEFYMARDAYQRDLAPMFFGQGAGEGEESDAAAEGV